MRHFKQKEIPVYRACLGTTNFTCFPLNFKTHENLVAASMTYIHHTLLGDYVHCIIAAHMNLSLTPHFYYAKPGRWREVLKAHLLIFSPSKEGRY